MTQALHKFIGNILNTVSPLYGSKLQIGDTFTQVLSKLQGLLTTASIRSSILTSTACCNNSTADFNVLAVTIPANTLREGDVISFHTGWSLSKTSGLSGINLNYYVKDTAGTKRLTCTHQVPRTPSTASGSFQFVGQITVRTIGVSGTYVVGGFLGKYTGAGDDSAASQSASLGIDTTVSNTFTIGISAGTASSGITVTSVGGLVKLE